MQLTFDQIKELTFGALSVRREEDEIHFDRFTEEAKAYFAKIRESFGKRAEFTTGIRLDFSTNSKTVAFTAAAGGKYEISVNSILRRQVRSDGTRVEIKLETPLEQPYNATRVTIWLPSHSIGVLQSVEIDDGAWVKPKHLPGRKILFLGDSITQGWHSAFDSLSFANRVATYFRSDFVNQGIGGYYYDANALFEQDFDPDWIFVAYGTNDWDVSESKAAFAQAVTDFYVKLIKKYGDKKIFVITPVWRDHTEHHAGETKCGRLEDVIALIRATAEGYGLHVIDGLKMIPPMKEFFTEDLLHPNDLGFGIYAENLLHEVQKDL